MSTNDITGDEIRTDVPSDKFKNGWDAIWGEKQRELLDNTEELIAIIINRDTKEHVPESCTKSSKYAS